MNEQETLNFWKQIPHVMKYFRVEEDENARLPKNFISGFLEVCLENPDCYISFSTN
jgi:NADH dehydrogenase (ubiquinone) 1 alpha subcomplex subunit 6